MEGRNELPSMPAGAGAADHAAHVAGVGAAAGVVPGAAGGGAQGAVPWPAVAVAPAPVHGASSSGHADSGGRPVMAIAAGFWRQAGLRNLHSLALVVRGQAHAPTRACVHACM